MARDDMAEGFCLKTKEPSLSERLRHIGGFMAGVPASASSDISPSFSLGEVFRALSFLEGQTERRVPNATGMFLHFKILLHNKIGFVTDENHRLREQVAQLEREVIVLRKAALQASCDQQGGFLVNEDVVPESVARTLAVGVGILAKNGRMDDEAPSRVSDNRLYIFMPMSPYPIEVRL